jgi:hypothetical protein
LKELMEFYYDTFESVEEFFREGDRTKILTVVQIITKCGVVLLILELLFSIEVLIVVGIWMLLFLTTSTGVRARKYFSSKLITMNNTVDGMIQSVATSSVARALSAGKLRSCLIFKEFYIFEYQRWWLGKDWMPSHYSDEDRKVVLCARIDPPVGWDWVGPWEIEKCRDTDVNGFEYTNDLIQNVYSASNSLKTIRRRKWVRVCKKSVLKEQSDIAQKMWSTETKGKAHRSSHATKKGT